MIRNFVLLALFVASFGMAINKAAHADTFTATYAELARSPAGYAASWYSGAVTKDGKFIYGYGQSHASYNNNGLWTYDPATNTHTSVFPDTGYLYRFDKDATGAGIAKSGRWAKLDPVANKALYDYFGGPDIYAPTNRNNHQAFYMPGVDQFWVMGGTSWDNGGWASYGRFDLKTQRWAHVSKPWSDPTKADDLKDFGTGMVAGSMSGWAAPNAATAVCTDLDTAVLFGGMADTWGGVRIIEPNPAGPEPYRWANAPKAPIHLPAENVRHNAACVGDTVYFVTGQERWPNESKLRTPDPAPFWKFHVPTRTWTKLTPGPGGAYFTVMTYDKAANALLVYGGGTGGGSDRLWVYDLKDATWHNLTGTVPKLPRVDHHTGGYLAGFGHVYKGGRRFDQWGADLGYTESSRMMRITLTRVATTLPPPEPEPAPEEPPVVTPPPVEPPPVIPPPPLQCPVGCVPAPVVEEPPVVVPPPPTACSSGWVDEALPLGSRVNEPWTWVTAPVYSGAKAHVVPAATGTHQRYFDGAAALRPAAGDVITTAVYVDPAAPPTEIMLQWHVGGEWTARAYWGANSIPWGDDGTASRRRIGSLPEAGTWVLLDVPAAAVGLEGKSITGLAFTLYGGKATFDATGIKKTDCTSAPPVIEPEPTPVPPTPPPEPTPAPAAIAWTKIPLPGTPLSPQGSSKHIRLVEGPGGRVYFMGGDWGGNWGENTGRQEVYSFDPLSPTGDWRLEAPYCGTVENPVHWHTDEAGAAWDAKLGVFWKLSGTEYGPDDSCLAAGGSVKAKVITFNPTTKLWTVPAGFSQMRFGHVTNGVLDPVKDEMIQITDTKAFHLSLSTGQWSEYPLWGEVLRFNANVAKQGRKLWWTNRRGVMESYDLDTHGLTAYTKVPWAVPAEGWLMEMVFALPDKLLVVRPTSGPGFARFAATFDPATQQWTQIDPGEGWGNGGTMLSSGRLILLGGGINGAWDDNKQVWVGTLK